MNQELIGPMIIGLEGTSIGPSDSERISNPNVGGIILFSRNFESVEQITRYVESIRLHGGHNKPVFVDHEGGRVQRFKEGFTAIPSMSEIGKIAAEDEDEGMLFARQVGYVLASELRACGIDMSFTPVLDLDWGTSGIIGDRAFGRDPRLVSRLAGALMHGLEVAGMSACGKHFPGHGWVRADSHHELPIDERPLNEILKCDALPYRLNNAINMAAVMPAHVVYNQVDHKPACFSKIWIEDVLRYKFGYDGAVISDDLDMVGAHGEGPIRERAQAALHAGCDAVLACNNFMDIDELIASPLEGAEGNRFERTRRLTRLLGKPKPKSWGELKADYNYLAALERIQR